MQLSSCLPSGASCSSRGMSRYGMVVTIQKGPLAPPRVTRAHSTDYQHNAGARCSSASAVAKTHGLRLRELERRAVELQQRKQRLRPRAHAGTQGAPGACMWPQYPAVPGGTAPQVPRPRPRAPGRGRVGGRRPGSVTWGPPAARGGGQRARSSVAAPVPVLAWVGSIARSTGARSRTGTRPQTAACGGAQRSWPRATEPKRLLLLLLLLWLCFLRNASE